MRAQARGLASEWIARQRVADHPAVKADSDMRKQAQEQAKEAKTQLDSMVRQCCKHIVYLAPKGDYERGVACERLHRESRHPPYTYSNSRPRRRTRPARPAGPVYATRPGPGRRNR